MHTRNAEVEQQIAHLRAELLHKEQENERVQMQLAKEKEERERAERQVRHSSSSYSPLLYMLNGAKFSLFGMHAISRHPHEVCLQRTRSSHYYGYAH